MNLWQAAAENLLRYRNKTVAIFIPLLLAVFFAAAMTFVRDGFLQDARLSLSLSPDITLQKFSGGRVERVSRELLERVGELDNVERVVPRVWGYVPIEYQGGTFTYSIIGLDLSRMPAQEAFPIFLEAGRFLEPGDSGVAVLGQVFARTLEAEVGDTITLRSYSGREFPYKIVGIFSSPVQIYTADLLLTTIDDARKFFDYEGDEATDLSIYLKDPLYTDALAARMDAELPNVRVLTREALSDATLQAYSGRSGIFQLIWLILLFTAMLIAWAQAANITMDMKREIGILKAVGWSTMEVIEVKLWESVIMALAATVGGLLLGLLYLRLGAPVIKDFFLGWASVFPEFPIPIVVDYRSVITLFIISVVPLLAATVIPAWRGGVVNPDTAIRGT